MNEWKDIKKELKQIVFLLKDVIKKLYSLVETSSNKRIGNNPFKTIVISNIVVAFLVSLIGVYWYVEFKASQKNQEKTTYIINEQVEHQKDSIEIEIRQLYKDIYKEKIDSLQNMLNELKSAQTPRKPRLSKQSNNSTQAIQKAATSVENTSESKETQLP